MMKILVSLAAYEWTMSLRHSKWIAIGDSLVELVGIVEMKSFGVVCRGSWSLSGWRVGGRYCSLLLVISHVNP